MTDYFLTDERKAFLLKNNRYTLPDELSGDVQEMWDAGEAHKASIVDAYGTWENVNLQEFGDAIEDWIGHGRLEFDQRVVPTFAMATALAEREGVLSQFFASLRHLMGNKQSRVHLYPDGLPMLFSFGVLWYAPLKGYPGNDNGYILKVEPKAYMNGGLIYSGPARPGSHEKKHSWTVHT